MVTKIEYLSMYRRKYIYVGMVVIAGVAILGALQIKTTGNITGDLPQNDQITTDLRFIEENFGGSIPFDLLIDTKDSNSFFNRFEQIEDVQNYLATYGVFSKSLSATDGVKIINMAFSGNDSTKYEIPSRTKLIQKILPHLPDSTNSRINPFLDSTGKITRITMQIKDIGSYEVQAIIDSITPEVDRLLNPDYKSQDSLYQLIIAAQGAKKNELINTLFADHAAIQQDLEFIYGGEGTDLARYHDKAGFSDSLKKAIDLNRWDVMYTGTSVVASNGTQYLVSNLFSSLAIAIVLIGFIMAFLFRSWRMVLISLVPNFIPLLVTAGVMGFTGIPMKPSTLIVFSIAFGISVDDTIHFLAKFRQELKHRRHDFRACILVALRETGASMIYTSIVLFCGFLMFSFSEFGGTKALGVLISLTLCVAMFSNLIILPTLLLWMDKKMTHKALKREPLLELYNEEEDIDLDYLEIENLAKKYEEEDIKQNKVEPDDESTQSES